MNENEVQAQPQKPQLPVAAEIVCTQCQEKIRVRIPRPRIANAIDTTVIVFAHERLDKCPKCGSIYMFSVAYIDHTGTLGLQWIKVETEQSAVIPGTNGNLSQALNQSDIVNKIRKPQ